MSKKEDDDFAEWQGKFAKEFEADPDAKAAWETLTGKAGEKVREHFYRGTLRQDEFHRRLNETQAEKQAAAQARAQAEQIVQQNWDWYKLSQPEYEKAVKRAEVLASLVQQAGIIDGVASTPGQTPANGSQASMSGQGNEELEQMKAVLAGMNRGLPNLLRDSAWLNKELAKGNWDVDPTAIFDYSTQRGVTLQQAFNDLTVDERAKRQEADIQARIDAGIADEKRKLMASYPTPDAMRGGPRASLHDQMKTMESLANPDSRREAGVALLRDHLVKSST